MKGYSITNKFNNNVPQQRKSSFIEPLSETARRKPAQGIEGRGDRDNRDPSIHNIFSQPPFPHLDDKKHPFKPYDSTNNSTTNLHKIKKRDTPKRLPKLENVSASLKLTSKTEVIEIIAEKPPTLNANKDIPFHVHKVTVTNPHSYYSKLPNLSSLNFNNNTTSTNGPGASKLRYDTTKNENRQHNDEHTKQTDIKQVQDNIQVLQNMHKQQHATTKDKISKLNYNNNSSYNEDIAPTIQNLQEIESIQENIHQVFSVFTIDLSLFHPPQ